MDLYAMNTDDTNYFYYVCKYQYYGCKSTLLINKTTGDFQTTHDHDDFCYKNHIDKQKQINYNFCMFEDQNYNMNMLLPVKENHIEDNFILNNSMIEKNYSNFLEDKSLFAHDSNSFSISNVIQNTTIASINDISSNNAPPRSKNVKRTERIGLKYKIFSFDDKEKCILLSNKKSLQFVSKKIGVQTKTLKRWIKNGACRKKGNLLNLKYRMWAKSKKFGA